MIGFRFINGIIEFDRKTQLLHSSLPSVDFRLLGKGFWSVWFFGLVTYYVSFQIKFALKLTHYIDFLFHSPNIVVMAVMLTSCFYLYHLGYRFRKLNALWKRLPPGLMVLPGGRWTDPDVAASVECVRLLHAELSDLIRMFSLGYGPVLLMYFSFTFTSTAIDILFIIFFKDFGVKLNVIPFIFYTQYVIFVVAILCSASWVIDKVYLPYTGIIPTHSNVSCVIKNLS